ncbi:MAG: cyclase family protein [Bacteroidales bacterium]
MKIIDLTQTISSEMPVYPGTEPPVIKDATTIEKDGFAEKLLSFFSHTGTHIDAPGHILKGRNTLDKFSADKFVGKGLVIDVTKCTSGKIEKDLLEKYSAEIEGCDFVLFKTGWDNKWGNESYFMDFPSLTSDAASWLCQFNIKGIGFDCISADPVDAADLPIHKIILNKNLIIIENLCNLDRLTGCPFIFSCLPLKIGNSDGSPVRAVGILDI